jgi:hypothetical protein
LFVCSGKSLLQLSDGCHHITGDRIANLNLWLSHMAFTSDVFFYVQTPAAKRVLLPVIFTSTCRTLAKEQSLYISNAWNIRHRRRWNSRPPNHDEGALPLCHLDCKCSMLQDIFYVQFARGHYIGWNFIAA